MKKIIFTWIAALLLMPVFAQQPEGPAPAADPEDVVVSEPEMHQDTIRVMDKVEVIETPENTRVTLGENEVLIVEENGDTVKVRLGSKGISIVEGKDGTEIKVIEMDEARKTPSTKKKKFRPHFAGLEIGLNNYLTPDGSLSLPPDQLYMDLNTGKSWNWNLNVIDYGFGLGTDKIGIATGLGFEFINYNFDGQNSIRKDPDTGNIIPYYPDYAGNIMKSKMNIAYVTAPLLLEFQIPAGKKRIHISGGVIGGVKMWSNTKLKYKISGEKSKEKARGDYNLSPLRWGFTARVGYRMINLYANYYMTPLFKENRGPELYPFSVGLALIPF